MNMRKLKTIQTQNNLNEVYALDEPNPQHGNANHMYGVYRRIKGNLVNVGNVLLQNGARTDNEALHGITNTDLLEIIRDNLNGFQSGKYACPENEMTIYYIEQALRELDKRTQNRAMRGVLGKYEK